jgi:signal transduction histidine kinase
MLDVAQLQLGQLLQLQRQPLDLVALAQEAILGFPEAHPDHPVRIQAAEPSLVGQWDAARVERVIGNLLGNAVKYSPSGGEIVIELDREEREGTGGAVLRVSDRGLGIPADEIPLVFERFYRGRNVTGKIHGTGIGLAGVRQIVEQHGGQLAVESVEGAGTTMSVWLPLESAPEPALAAER